MKTDKACPFCGQNSVRVIGEKRDETKPPYATGYQVECINCGSRGPSGMHNEANAVLAWNIGDNGFRRKS